MGSQEKAGVEEVRVVVARGERLRTLVWTPAARAASPAFLLVHGLASNALLWRGIAERLAAAGHRTVAVDQRGHGESGGAGPGVAGVDGGVIDLAARFPDWDTCRTALAPPRLAGTPYEELGRSLRMRHPGWPEEAVAGQLANLAVRDDGTVEPRLAHDDHLAILRTLWEHRPAGYLPEVRVPVLLLPVVEPSDEVGSRAKRRSIELATGLLDDLRVRWFVDRSHDVHAEAPDEVAAELLEAAAAWTRREQGGAA